MGFSSWKRGQAQTSLGARNDPEDRTMNVGSASSVSQLLATQVQQQDNGADKTNDHDRDDGVSAQAAPTKAVPAPGTGQRVDKMA